MYLVSGVIELIQRTSKYIIIQKEAETGDRREQLEGERHESMLIAERGERSQKCGHQPIRLVRVIEKEANRRMK